MLTYLARLATVAALLTGLTACGGDYIINNPADKSIHQTPPDIVVSYKKTPESLPNMVLNGQPVTEFFAPTPTEATATGEDLADFVVQGNNRFQVSPPTGPQVNFIYDTQGPRIVITQATRAGTVNIEGIAVDAAGARSVRVNGIEADVEPTGRFSVQVSPADTYTFQATDVLDQSSSVVFGDALLINRDLIKARIQEDGIDFIATELVDVVNALDLNALVAGTELYRSGIFRGELTSLSMKAESFALDPTNNGINLTGVFTNVRAQLRLVQVVVIRPTAVIDRVIMNGNVTVGVNSNNELEAVINTLNVDAQGIHFEGALGGLDRFLGGVISGLVNQFENRIGNAIKGAVNNTLKEKLADLIPTSYSLPVACRELGIDFKLNSVSTTDDSLIIGLSGAVLANSVSSAVPPPLGPIYTADPLPTPVFGAGDMSFAINANGINQALVSIYSAGLTHLMMLNGNTYVNIPRDDALGNNGDSRILIDSLTPPQISITNANGKALTTIDLPRLQISSEAKQQNGAWNEAFRVVLSAKVAASLAIGSDNKLSITMGDNPSIAIEEAIVAGKPTSGNNLVNEAIRIAIPKIMANISTSINGIEIPSIAGFAITTEAISAIGTNHRHLGISGKLNKLPGDGGGDGGGGGGGSDGGGGDGGGDSNLICFP